MQSAADVLPMQVAGDEHYPEDIRLRYRFIDLRREKLRDNILLRSNVIASIRRRMIEAGFTEFQTPILTASSPGRRARLPGAVAGQPGQVLRPAAGAAAVQAAGDGGRASTATSRSPPASATRPLRAGRTLEFYQLDFEMSFVTQEDVFATIEPVLAGVFEEFANGRGGHQAAVPAHRL